MNSTVTILIVAKNEEASIKNIINDIELQTYPLDLMEIIFVDSNSEDSTKSIMLEYATKNLFKEIKVFDNPKGTLAPGWNIGLREFKTDYIVRIDAHSSLSKNFIEESVKLLDRGEYVVGGPRPNIINPQYQGDRELEILLAVETAFFGAGIAYYRNGEKQRNVKSVFHGMFKKEVIERVGLLNEALGRTEDNEYFYRVRKCGYVINYSPSILSYQYVRENFKSMCIQKYNNGYWIGKTFLIEPACLSIFHLAPLVLLFGTIIIILLTFINKIFIFALVPYFLLILINSIFVSIKQVFFIHETLKLFIYFVILHYLYGLGTLRGLLSEKN